MFHPSVYQRDWLHQNRRRLGQCDPAILEKCVYALTLLGALAETGLPFLFKGGTSLLLHLSQVRRLSRDIDIVCGRPPAEVDSVLARIGRQPPFLRWAEDDRGIRDLPQRRHFKFFYRSDLSGDEQEVLLDVVEETREVHSVVDRPIRTPFLEPEREIRVRVPTIEALLGDKLTAFAPTTTGVRLRRDDGAPADVQQVAKQLFDVGILFDAATDFATVASVYDAVCAQESGYRPTRPSRAAALDDTWRACLALTATKPAILADYPDAPLLHDGLDRMRGHLVTPEYVKGREARRALAAKAAVLVAHLRAGRHFDFAAARYAGHPTQLAAVRSASLNGTPYAWLDSMKSVNPEAYHYWHASVLLAPTGPF